MDPDVVTAKEGKYLLSLNVATFSTLMVPLCDIDPNCIAIFGSLMSIPRYFAVLSGMHATLDMLSNPQWVFEVILGSWWSCEAIRFELDLGTSLACTSLRLDSYLFGCGKRSLKLFSLPESHLPPLLRSLLYSLCLSCDLLLLLR